MFKYFIIFLFICFAVNLLYAQSRIGDPGWNFDESKYDTSYSDMVEWAKAGVEGGIPFLASTEIAKTISPTNSEGINNAINEVIAIGGGQLRLLNGTYTIDQQVYVKSGIRIVGESRDNVILNITQLGENSAIVFTSGTQYAGLDNLTIQGGYGVPNDYDFANVMPEFSTTSISLQSGSQNCWIDNLKIINNGSTAISIYNSSNHTVRDCYIERTWNKGVGGNGYFALNDATHCLIYNNFVTKMRHFTIAGSNAMFNVIYGNSFEVDVNFHNGDGGHNLVESNSIILPDEHWWVPFQTGSMGLHSPPGDSNYIYRNTTYNEGASPQSDPDTIYTFQDWEGPVGTNWPIPGDSTFYAVSEFPYTPVSSIHISPPNLILEKDQTSNITTTVLPADASNKTFLYSSSNSFIASISSDDVVTAKSAGVTTITARTIDGSKKALCQVKVHGIAIPADLALNVNKDSTLTASLFLPDAADTTVIWRSGKNEIATVDSSGKVSGVSFGKAVIYATTVWGNYQDSCNVVVLDSNIHQYVETLENMTLVGWGSETFTGDNDFTWTVNGKGSAGFIDTSKCFYFQAKDDQQVSSGQIPGGISSFSITCRDLWDAGVERVLELYVNDSLVGASIHKGAEIYEYSIDNINIAGNITFTLKNASSRDVNNSIAIDNITWTTYGGPPTSLDNKDELPGQFFLGQNYPNPFNPTTVIDYQLRSSGKVSLVIYNILGQKIRTLVDANMAAGSHSTTWNGLDNFGRSIANGIYIYHLKSESEVSTRKMILLK